MKRSLLLFTSANLIGLFVYVRSLQAIRHGMLAEGRDYSDFGDSVEFVYTALPAVALCLLLNVVWGVLGLRDAAQFRGYRSLASCVVVVAVWVATISVVRRFP